MVEIRSRKIEEMIKVKLSTLLLRDLKDPRLDSFITILGVSLSKDCRSARVIVSVIGSKHEQHAAIRGLDNARGYIQRRLGREMRIKYIPHLIFQLDDKTEETVRFVHRLVESERRRETGEETAQGTGAQDEQFINDIEEPEEQH
jgi:ribosome-binding factor A